jgi:tRNA(Arg) A34 adenosine deaminase TadA
MRLALEQAEAARDGGDWAIGCVVVFDGQVVARGRNRVFSDRNRLKHAEIDAIEQLQADFFDRNPSNSTNDRLVLYTTFEPCPMCFGALLVSGIRHIVAGVNFDRSGASAYFNHLPLYFQRPHFRTKFMTGVLARDCAEMWRSGRPVVKLLEYGFKMPVDIETITNDSPPEIFTTVTMNEIAD